MNKNFLRVLLIWVLHVMYMLASRSDLFSKDERDTLAQNTANLEKEIYEELKK